MTDNSNSTWSGEVSQSFRAERTERYEMESAMEDIQSLAEDTYGKLSKNVLGADASFQALIAALTKEHTERKEKQKAFDAKYAHLSDVPDSPFHSFSPRRRAMIADAVNGPTRRPVPTNPATRRAVVEPSHV